MAAAHQTICDYDAESHWGQALTAKARLRLLADIISAATKDCPDVPFDHINNAIEDAVVECEMAVEGLEDSATEYWGDQAEGVQHSPGVRMQRALGDVLLQVGETPKGAA